jgi:hypothetical protein
MAPSVRISTYQPGRFRASIHPGQPWQSPRSLPEDHEATPGAAHRVEQLRFHDEGKGSLAAVHIQTQNEAELYVVVRGMGLPDHLAPTSVLIAHDIFPDALHKDDRSVFGKMRVVPNEKVLPTLTSCDKTRALVAKTRQY